MVVRVVLELTSHTETWPLHEGENSNICSVQDGTHLMLESKLSACLFGVALYFLLDFLNSIARVLCCFVGFGLFLVRRWWAGLSELLWVWGSRASNRPIGALGIFFKNKRAGLNGWQSWAILSSGDSDLRWPLQIFGDKLPSISVPNMDQC